MSSSNLIARYGAETASSPVTVQSILNLNLYPSPDPFRVLLVSLQRDMYGHNHALRVAGKVFTGILAL